MRERFVPKIVISDPGAAVGENELRSVELLTIPYGDTDGVETGDCPASMPATISRTRDGYATLRNLILFFRGASRYHQHLNNLELESPEKEPTKVIER